MKKIVLIIGCILVLISDMVAQERHMLIDTDTASDDAVALVIAMKHKDVNIEAITTVSGNVPVEQSTQNALYTAELAGSDADIYQGLGKPLIRPLKTAQYTHGNDGMGDVGMELSGRTPAGKNAIDIIIDTINEYPGEIELVTLGPLTNIAAALIKEPGIADKVKSCTIMGGVGIGYGNVTPVSEYNIWTDPDAAQIVFQSGMPITMVGWDISRKYAVIDDENVKEIRAIDTPLAHFSVDIQNTLTDVAQKDMKLAGFDLPDPIAMSVALDPSVATDVQSLYVEVDLSDGITRGQTIVDHLGVTDKDPNVNVVLKADREKFLDMYYSSIK